MSAHDRKGALAPTAPASFASAPLAPLTVLACVGALADLVLQRYALRAVAPSLSHATAIEIARWLPLPRNAAALGGLAVLGLALWGFVRHPGRAYVVQRLGLAAISGMFLPTMALATALPASRMTPEVVLFASGAGAVLATSAAMYGLRWPGGPRGLRIALWLVVLASFCSLLALFGTVTQPLMHETVRSVWRLVRGVGEIAFLLVPVAAGASTVLVVPGRRAWLAVGIGAVAAAVGALGLAAVRVASRGELGVILYGAQHLELVADLVPDAYVAPIAMGLGIGVAAACAPHVAARQAGLGMLLWWAGGFAPRAPGRLLFGALGVVLLARACIALGERARDAARGDTLGAERQPAAVPSIVAATHATEAGLVTNGVAPRSDRAVVGGESVAASSEAEPTAPEVVDGR
ncbi:MAG: hypothetical protein NZ898_13750 [Myxococcota bacterium]|nr:hypothetical protein [Myxococcota bacterium]MDW8363816.1 hypothetical protein [Myxococcales bacterium]